MYDAEELDTTMAIETTKSFQTVIPPVDSHVRITGRIQKPRLRTSSISGAISSDSWAWVELNYRPHAYQAASYEHELSSEVPTRLPFPNILLSISAFTNMLRTFHEHFVHLNGHHNGHHSPCDRYLVDAEERFSRHAQAAVQENEALVA
jgi:hypothetical protein